MRLVHLDYFRGIAILAIVAGHSFGSCRIDSVIERAAINLIAGGTTLFVFISGFFFHHVYSRNFNLTAFLVKKSKNVLLPYAVLTVTAVTYYAVSSRLFPNAGDMGANGAGSWALDVGLVVDYLRTGNIAIGYWYIPFISIIFVMSPLFVRYISLSASSRIILFVFLLLASMLAHRPSGNLSSLHSVIYFTPIYMLGMISSIHRDIVARFIERKSAVIGAVVLGLAVLQALFYDGYGNFHKQEIFSYDGVDIIILQKIAMCFFLLSVLQRYGNRNMRGLKLTASLSFAIYFIHPWVIRKYSAAGLLSFFESSSGLMGLLVIVPLVVATSILVAYALKAVLSENSRCIIGW